MPLGIKRIQINPDLHQIASDCYRRPILRHLPDALINRMDPSASFRTNRRVDVRPLRQHQVQGRVSVLVFRVDVHFQLHQKLYDAAMALADGEQEGGLVAVVAQVGVGLADAYERVDDVLVAVQGG